jgi:hypothetical protein
MSHTAFFYGTLMAPPVLHRVIWGQPKPPTPAHAQLLTIRPAILHAHRRYKVRNASFPAILPTKAGEDSTVRGTLVTGLTDGDIWRLDIFEGDMYERREVTVRLLEGEDGVGDLSKYESGNKEGGEVVAETYIWVQGQKQLESSEWDFTEFVKEKMSAWVGDAEDGEEEEGIQDVDAAVAARNDHTGGRGANGKITRELEKSREKEEEVLKSAV